MGAACHLSLLLVWLPLLPDSLSFPGDEDEDEEKNTPFLNFIISLFLFTSCTHPVSVSALDEFAHFTLVCIDFAHTQYVALLLLLLLALARSFFSFYCKRLSVQHIKSMLSPSTGQFRSETLEPGSSLRMVQMEWQWEILTVTVAATTVIENRITGIEE